MFRTLNSYSLKSVVKVKIFPIQTCFRPSGLRPMQLGLIEIALCVVLLVALGAVGV